MGIEDALKRDNHYMVKFLTIKMHVKGDMTLLQSICGIVESNINVQFDEHAEEKL
jgi:hypothetical protein